MGEWVKIAKLSELTDNVLKPVHIGPDTMTIGRVDIAIVRVNGRLFAFDDTCPHAACSISPGEVENGEVTCFCHVSVFKVETGEKVEGPTGRGIKLYPVYTEGDYILVEV